MHPCLGFSVFLELNYATRNTGGFEGNGRTAGLDGFDIGGPTASRWGDVLLFYAYKTNCSACNKHNILAAFSLRGPVSCNQLFAVPRAERRADTRPCLGFSVFLELNYATRNTGGFEGNGRTAGLDGFDIGGPTASRWGDVLLFYAYVI
ncbi:hypothetical protein NDU88_003175 [Pleurodeles waltl]|uniref:Uncharacterized protein n=1 Tax=Pleurodeles waltl TaxID=8319 RepID=A0AAV7W1D9_PLEWA|nr:hypothetical protein NDU88_003175 [Pleurodeles waltl]